jgi:hypothetical protein
MTHPPKPTSPIDKQLYDRTIIAEVMRRVSGSNKVAALVVCERELSEANDCAEQKRPTGCADFVLKHCRCYKTYALITEPADPSVYVSPNGGGRS